MAGHLAISLDDVDSLETELCGICYQEKPSLSFHEFDSCTHRFCTDCIERAYHDNVTSSRINVQCLECKEPVHPEELRQLIKPELYDQFLTLSLRKWLAGIPEARYCLSPDCPYACIATKTKSRSAQEQDKHFVCRHEECQKDYCNVCKLPWHPEKTCEEARADAPESEAIPEATLKKLNAKPCPNCTSMIEKRDDGSCNSIKCTVCQTNFCWLCMQQVSEMHFMSPSGCPMFGTERWSRRKSYCCRLWLWLLTPLLTLLLAVLLIPLVIVLLPILVGYLVNTSKCTQGRSTACRIVMVIVFTLVALFLSPIIAILCSVLVFPLVVLYAYCFVPIQICRANSSVD